MHSAAAPGMAAQGPGRPRRPLMAEPFTVPWRDTGIPAPEDGVITGRLHDPAVHCGHSASFSPLQAARCLEAARGGDAAAQYMLGLMCCCGQGAAQNFSEALKWLRLAALQGYTAAEYRLGLLYYSGKGTPGRGGADDEAEAAAWIIRAAGKGLPEAENCAGNLFFMGRGVERDYAGALSWYRRVAGHGCAEAANSLAVMHLRGRASPLTANMR